MYDDIILDIDGTIWNTTGVVSVAWNKAIRLCGLSVRPVNAQDLQKEFGKPMDAIARSLWPSLSAAEQDVLMAHCCSEEQRALRATELDLLYPHVLETVRELSGTCSFYVVSNCQDGYVELMLEKTGLSAYVRDFECFGRTGKGKAENLLMLIQRNQLASPLYVGDTQGDCDACAQAGVPFAWAAYGFGHAAGYVARLDDFSDLKTMRAALV